ncbi:flavin reductase family protein [Streptomyces sp. NBC_01477]|uniref:flavin reductase family protein n=1 Tax=Streptomyces sp. NBC_01477 TaxID=2976015 RepID=UPI002E32D417|nr:flavin reductase family protein [Streptomyces sp. NBC_01477]
MTTQTRFEEQTRPAERATTDEQRRTDDQPRTDEERRTDREPRTDEQTRTGERAAADGRAAAGEQPGPAEHPLSPGELRRVFGAFPTGVTAVAALVDGIPVGLAANSFTAVSLDPPLLSVCVAHTSTTWPLLADRARLGITVLSADQERACAQLAARSDDRFTGLDWHATEDGAVLLDGAGAWFDTSVEQHIRAGDHDIVLLRIHALEADHTVAPLVFHGSRFRRLEQTAAQNEARPTPRTTGTEESS